MKNTIIVFLSFFSLHAAAQPVIHHALDYMVGDTFSINSTSIISNLVEPTGSNYTWDFSGLSTTTTNSITENKVISLSSIPYSSSFPSADFLINYITTHSGSTQLCGFDYFQKAGVAKYWGSIVLTINYPDTIKNTVQYTVPKLTTSPVLTIASSFSDSFSYAGTYPQSGFTSTIADGYGTLKLPGHSYDSVLRTRTTQISSGNMPVITYRWFRNNYKTPLLQIDSFSGYAYGHYVPYYQVHYLLYESATMTSVPTVSKRNLSYTALFRDNNIIVNGSFEKNRQYTASVFNLSGQKVYTENILAKDNSFIINTNISFPAGIYILNIASSFDNSSIKIVKQ